MKRIQNTQLDMPSLGSRAWTAPATDSNDHSGWWTYKRGNGMLLLRFHTGRSILTANQLRQRGPRAIIYTPTRRQFRNQMRPCVLRYRMPMVQESREAPLSVLDLIFFQAFRPHILACCCPQVSPRWPWEGMSTQVQHQLHQRGW